MPIQITSRYVTRKPEILSGEPTIIGTKTTVRAIVGLWRLAHKRKPRTLTVLR